MDTNNKIYYVYAWYFKSTGEIFHIGKGKGNRCNDIKNHRNKFFLNIINKHKDEVDVKILFDEMFEKEALDKERELISEYKSKGQCKTNLHEGGYGGYTGNYDNPERSRKISEAMKEYYKTHISPTLGRKRTDEEKRHLSNIMKSQCRKMSPELKEKLRKVNTGRKMLQHVKELLSKIHKGKKIVVEKVREMIEREADWFYFLCYKDVDFALCYGFNSVCKFCEKHFRISRSILPKIRDGIFKPKFNRHKWIEDFKIKRIQKDSVEHYDFDVETKAVILDEQTFDEVVKVKDEYIKSANLNRYGVENKYYS